MEERKNKKVMTKEKSPADEYTAEQIELFLELIKGKLLCGEYEVARGVFNEHFPAQKELNLAKEIREYLSVTEGYISVTEVRKSLQLVTKQDNTNVRVILHRLVQQGMLERHPSKDGVFRKIDLECEEIDWRNAPTNPLPLILPFDLHKLVNLYSKNIIVVAGIADAGKTCLLLNVAKLNMYQFKTKYFSSEMGSSELKIRLDKFDDTHPGGWNVDFYERASNFEDVIEPDGLNIIDYLEQDDTFYKVGGMIKRIWDKLEKGTAFIAIQKPRGRDLAYGGSFTEHKARLYLSMDKGTMKIVKAKNWKDGNTNPNGLIQEFKIVNGAKIIPQGGWHEDY